MAPSEKTHERVVEETSRRRSAGTGRDTSTGFSDAEDKSGHSPVRHEIGGVSGCSSELDLEGGVNKVHLEKAEKDCRICHLSLESGNQESGIPIELGCSCKDDLAAAHKQCAETWFKIKGDKTCEICGATARNLVGANDVEFTDQLNETSNPVPPAPQETQRFWRGHRFLNFLLACMVSAFVISWLCHFNIPS